VIEVDKELWQKHVKNWVSSVTAEKDSVRWLNGIVYRMKRKEPRAEP
jgi:hypothetical protein